ncbi:unnamed protein product [Nesidiocoris tenuis]|uniref:Uncharacterized protein n=1 Tax=Nesidiocoris tenuis TaxID=355587 RepID=A0A6H5FWY0_9HEMI|nr:unnamed protein product [Nesidiocoris tenuis]
MSRNGDDSGELRAWPAKIKTDGCGFYLSPPASRVRGEKTESQSGEKQQTQLRRLFSELCVLLDDIGHSGMF